MLRTTRALGVCLLLGLPGLGCNDATENLELFQADLSPANEVPARSSPAAGVAGFVFDGTTVQYSIEVDDLAESFMAHIHSGAAGANGSVRVWLYPVGGNAPGTPQTITDKRIYAAGEFTAANVTGISFEQLLSEMRAGTAYVNLHSLTYPGGEIRGQVRLLSKD